MATASPNNNFNHKRANPHARPSFKLTCRPRNNEGQYFKNNSKYQKQTTHTNAIEDYEAMYLNMCENFRAKISDSKPIPTILFWITLIHNGWILVIWLWHLIMDFGFENWLFVIYLNYLIIYLFMQIVWHIRSHLFWIRFKLFVWKFQYT